MKGITLLGSASGLAAVAVIAAHKPQVGYPTGYRSWYHVKSLVLRPGHPLYEGFGGLHHVYANEKAKKGLESGHYEDGAIFVFDLFEAPSEGNAISEGARKVLAVMQKNAKRFEDKSPPRSAKDQHSFLKGAARALPSP